MSIAGPQAFYNTLEKIKDQLLSDENVNTVTSGDLTEIDLNKATIFPLAHIIVNNAQLQGNTILFNISILAMDVVWQSKSNVTARDNTLDYDSTFIGEDNEHDVLNTQLAVLNGLNEVLRRGDLYTDKFQLDGVPSCEPFFDRFENKLAGWTYTANIIVQNDFDIC